MLLRSVRRRLGRVFFTFVFSYVAVLLVPLIVGTVAYTEAGRIVSDQTARANEVLLEQAQRISNLLDSAVGAVPSARTTPIEQINNRVIMTPLKKGLADANREFT